MNGVYESYIKHKYNIFIFHFFFISSSLSCAQSWYNCKQAGAFNCYIRERGAFIVYSTICTCIHNTHAETETRVCRNCKMQSVSLTLQLILSLSIYYKQAGILFPIWFEQPNTTQHSYKLHAKHRLCCHNECFGSTAHICYARCYG